MHKYETLFGIIVVFSLFLLFSSGVKASVTHAVISEIQIGETGHAENEFVELYNPTESDINLAGWRLKTGTQNLVASMSGTLKSHGYYLVAKPQYLTIPITPEEVYSASSSAMTSGSSVILQQYLSGAFLTVDMVGMSTASAYFEGGDVAPPAPGTSIERKANRLST